MRTVFFDVDTQLDFICPAGALYTHGAEEIVHNLQKLTNFAAANAIPLISTTDAHAEDDPEFQVWKPHCVVGTTGQQKVSETILRNSAVLTTIAGATVPTAAQVIVQKQHIDCFTNPNLEGFLRQFEGYRFVVYGLLTEFCVQSALFGLLRMGFTVEAVTDATKSYKEAEGQVILERFQTEGGALTTVSKVTA